MCKSVCSLIAAAGAQPPRPPGHLEQAAVQLALSAGGPPTIDAYAATYTNFFDWLRAVHDGALPGEFTALDLRGYRHWMRSAGAAPATVAQRTAALRHLAAHVELEPSIQSVGVGESRRPGPSLLLTAAQDF